MEAQTPRKGPIEGTSRVLRELLRTPRFKQSVRIILRDLDPENARLLVKTLMWEDPEFTLSLLAAMPDILNAALASLDEMVAQGSTFPPVVLTGFIAGVVEQLDSRALGRAMGRALVLSSSLSAVKDETLADAAAGFWAGVGEGFAEAVPTGAAGLALDALVPALGSTVSRLGASAADDASETRRLAAGLTDAVRTVASENPEFMQQVVLPLMAAGREALADAEAAAMDAEGEV
jgi:hypothetical protein